MLDIGAEGFMTMLEADEEESIIILESVEEGLMTMLETDEEESTTMLVKLVKALLVVST